MSAVGKYRYKQTGLMAHPAAQLSGCGSSSVSIRAGAGTGGHHCEVGAGYGKELLRQTAHMLRCCVARVRRFQEQRQ